MSEEVVSCFGEEVKTYPNVFATDWKDGENPHISQWRFKT
jgi:hypothetical protein